MILDFRWVLSVFFSILGLIVAAHANARAPLTDAPVNLAAGLAMLGFAAAVGLLAWRSQRNR